METKIEGFFKEQKGIVNFTQKYLENLASLFNQIPLNEVENFINSLIKARDNDSTIYFIGNGGSAATATHFANDLTSVHTKTNGKAFRAISLCDNNAIITAFANDMSFENIFEMQLKALLRPNDVVVAISASGNSANLLKGIALANEMDCITFGLVGFSGGKLKEICQHSVHIPNGKGEYGPAEDLHMILNHITGNYLLYLSHSEMKH